MNFKVGDVYHVYNQGNNRQKIFFSQENYFFFLRKIKELILPHADILAWCLMPNHFHLMIYIHTIEIEEMEKITGSATFSRAPSMSALNLSSATYKFTKRTLNKSIGILLASYTRAINNQENRTGSLFRDKTKAECVTNPNGISPSFFNSPIGTRIAVYSPEKEYPQVCFNYIHVNPVEAGLVKREEEWEFSSYLDYFGGRKGKLINKERTEEFGICF